MSKSAQAEDELVDQAIVTIQRVKLEQMQTQMEAVMVELFDARGKLAMCRQIMEANDPLNAIVVFGPPVPEPQSESAVAEGATAAEVP